MNAEHLKKMDNAEEAIEELSELTSALQCLLDKAETAHNCTADEEAVFVDKLEREVWVNVPIDGFSDRPGDSVRILVQEDFRVANVADPEGEIIFKYEV